MPSIRPKVLRPVALLCFVFCWSSFYAKAQDLEGANHGYASNEGVKIHYVEMGAGPLIVMLHGFPDYWYAWRNQMKALSNDFKVVAVDLRGYNLSDSPDGVDNYQMIHLMNDVEAVIKHHGQDNAVVIGHDWGAGIAWNIGIYKPHLVSHLVTLSVPHPSGFNQGLTEAAQANNNQSYADGFLAEDAHLTYTPQWMAGWVTDQEAKPYYLEAFKRSDRKAMLNYYKANFSSGQQLAQNANNTPSAAPPKIKAPVLMIHGMKDQFMPKSGYNNTWDWVEKDMTLVTLPNAGHFVMQDEDEAVTQIISDWLSRQYKK